MDTNLRREYLKLVQDARLFIDPNSTLPPSASKDFAPQIVPLSGSASRLPEKEQEKPKLQVKNEKSTKDASKPTQYEQEKAKLHVNWELQPMAQAEENRPFLTKVAAFVPTHELKISTFLVLPEENAAHRLFLENVSRVITRTFAPASVVAYQDKLFSNCKSTNFLAPIGLLKNTFPQLQIHQPFKTATCTMIALEDLDVYAHDVKCKRALWNAIQLLFQS